MVHAVCLFACQTPPPRHVLRTKIHRPNPLSYWNTNTDLILARVVKHLTSLTNTHAWTPIINYLNYWSLDKRIPRSSASGLRCHSRGSGNLYVPGSPFSRGWPAYAKASARQAWDSGMTQLDTSQLCCGLVQSSFAEIPDRKIVGASEDKRNEHFTFIFVVQIILPKMFLK